MTDSIGKASQGDRETVLVVDDSPHVRAVVREMLTVSNYETLEAASASEAVAVCKQHHGDIHLLLTDVYMPDQTGPDLAAAVRELYPGMKCLYMSGYTLEDVARWGVDPARDVVVSKPLDIDTLAAHVREALER